MSRLWFVCKFMAQKIDGFCIQGRADAKSPCYKNPIDGMESGLIDKMTSFVFVARLDSFSYELMIKRITRLFSQVFLYGYIGLMFLPLYLALVGASHDGAVLMKSPIPVWPGTSLLTNMKVVLFEGLAATGGEPVTKMLINSFMMAILIAAGKIILALLSAFALVYFKLPFKRVWFVLILLTMMLPVEVRIVPTFQVVALMGGLNSFTGLTLPLMASATATFLFRQFFKTIPQELVDAATLDGAGPVRFFIDILLPLSKPQLAALFIIMFVYGWNQYLWPLVITTNPDMATIVMGIRSLAGVADQIPQWHYIMTVALVALLPPCVIVIVFQRWFERGLMN
ncbi:sn-glycerol 3-phosphate transport system permease protein [Legionella longbeachae]|uniref:sn-glycerol-3-phosphate transport system permease protein UgpE n=2 Tax=Legionella oakridgensis TaxID=29423 RepID=A0A0W0X023_9GAMM|nr:sn-glycerol-3-phosphate ABC transporter permease UgpE [Legionella oakridgensis]ETO93107.1 carbohydrate ABC transporter ATP-binding protein, CUT1 family [Legionella oakridgensis RV-2-2007]KTD37934.1 sn-glycerol-3-phosphate transmembrane ABC transporter [Legionella oakridgensis]STY20345.1 sn-glycerol 3-phosphate transport system permease protein [Legionella longbeachae]